MCGIVGIIKYDGTPRENRETIRRMSVELIHRGPDSDGFYLDSHCSLGFRRLSIIDLTTGDQPVRNENETVWVILNGEIYNFKELRRDLESKGHRFRTSSDTETVVHAYEQYGIECVDRLRGMFALAVWDVKARRLLVARDRLGKKPLYYFAGANSFVFASEIKALLQHPEVPRDIDPQAVDEYLTKQYIGAPRSILQHVKKLPPAHRLTLDVPTRACKIEQYWLPAYTPKSALSFEEASVQLREKLTEAVRLRMISDVPLGALLSGGVDSTVVVGLMAQISTQPVKTFSIGFEDDAFNELPYARMAAKRFGTDHHEFIVKPSAADVLPKLVHYLDEPMADPSVLPTYYVSQLARKHVTVVLNGDGGDEVFGGYDSYAAMFRYARYATLPGWLRQRIIKPALNLFPMFHVDHPISRARRLELNSSLPLERQFARWTTISQLDWRQKLYTQGFAEQVNMCEYSYPQRNGMGMLDWMLRTDTMNYLPGDLLVKMDRMSMAHSLEARSPLLDHEIVELAARLPESYKRNSRRSGKIILKHACADLLSNEILNRPKAGFAVPIARWFRGELKEMAQDLLFSSSRREWFREGSLQVLLDEHNKGIQDNSHKLWAISILELWMSQFAADRSYSNRKPTKMAYI